MCETVVTPSGYMLVKESVDGIETTKLYDKKNRLVEYQDSVGNHFIYRFDNGSDIPSQFNNLNTSVGWVDYEDDFFDD
jgi:hypothetical protein